MTDLHIAAVETLTAEVSVLQMGACQISLSIYKQLDTVSIWRNNSVRARAIWDRVHDRTEYRNSGSPRTWSWLVPTPTAFWSKQSRALGPQCPA